MSGVIQSVAFVNKDRANWNVAETAYWLIKNRLNPIKPMHADGNSYRYRIVDPNKFSKYSTKVIHSRGKQVDLIIGYK